MSTVIVIGVVAGCALWIWKGRESTAAIFSNLLQVLAFGGGGILLVAMGSGLWVVVGIACILYAVYGVYHTVPWVLERLKPDGR